MTDILSRISSCVEYGKIDKACPYPPEMKGQDGADVLDVNVGFPGVAEKITPIICATDLIMGHDDFAIRFIEYYQQIQQFSN